jgi:hypothetical protein
MLLWLSRGDLKGETESEILAAQSQALQTRYQVIKMLKTKTESKCKLCQQYNEKIDHSKTACSVLAKRHDRGCA